MIPESIQKPIQEKNLTILRRIHQIPEFETSIYYEEVSDGRVLIKGNEGIPKYMMFVEDGTFLGVCWEVRLTELANN